MMQEFRAVVREVQEAFGPFLLCAAFVWSSATGLVAEAVCAAFVLRGWTVPEATVFTSAWCVLSVAVCVWEITFAADVFPRVPWPRYIVACW